jgi:hypothetical protein
MEKSRINLWSSPRNISTAMMYSFAQRDDMSVVDEPLYAHYLTHTDTQVLHPVTSQILESQEVNGQKVVSQMLYGDYNKPCALFKQMTHHLIYLEEDFLGKMKNVLLIRDPRRIIASYAKVIPNPTIQDIGVKMQAELFEKLQKKNALNAIVDTKQVLLNPKKVLRALCDKLEIPFTEKMLKWRAGARPEDGVWAPYWYSNVHSSTGFQPYVEKEVYLSEELEKLAKECIPHYELLRQHAIEA